MQRFEGRTAVITGASRGIGLAIAQRLVDEGARVVVTGRKQKALDAAVEELGGPDRALGIAGHAADVEHQADTIQRAIGTFGSADLLVNNTGTGAYGPIIDLDLDIAQKIVEVNVLAALSWTQQLYQAWLAKHGGAIVNVSTVASTVPTPDIGMYGASKAMLNRVTQQLAVELGPDIRVNAVAPAVVKTAFATGMYEGRENEVAATYPLKRLGVPHDIAGVVAFLLSQDAAWITGQLLVVDGGLTLVGAG